MCSSRCDGDSRRRSGKPPAAPSVRPHRSRARRNRKRPHDRGQRLSGARVRWTPVGQWPWFIIAGTIPSMRSAIAALAASATIALPAPQPPSGWAHVASGYRAALQQAGIVGSSLMLLRNGRVLAHENVGRQDAESGTPVDDDTIYHWASITKTF